MATAFETEITTQKHFRGNVVIKLLGQYFCRRQPDSGLTVPSANVGTVGSLILNPTQVDLKRVSQTINSYSFKLVDKSGVLTALVKDRADAFVSQQVEIWIGRSGTGFDFSNYFKLPNTRVKKIGFDAGSYSFSVTETTDRMNKSIFSLSDKLSLAVTSSTTIFVLQGPTTDFPTTGTAKIGDEFISWTGKDDALHELTGVNRGLLGSTAAAHAAGDDFYNAVTVTDNPIDVLLKILISGGGGGTYDVYSDGLAIDPALIDVTGMEAIRDALFFGEQYSFTLYNVQNALQFIESELLLSCNARFIVSESSQISIAILDQAIFGDAPNSIDESSIASVPKWEVDDNNIYNIVQVDYDYDEVRKIYLKTKTIEDAVSITNFGAREPYTMRFKGVRESLGGAAIVTDRITRFLARFATPNPQITFKSHVDKQLVAVGSKVLVSSRQIPSASGTLQFATELEVISRAINHDTGDVTFKLAFTSYSGIRACYISPSDIIPSFSSQSAVTLNAGRGAAWEPTWKVRLWDTSTHSYCTDSTNEILSVVGDVVTFVTPWATTLVNNRYRLKFCDYDEATLDQKRYCFIGYNGANFTDGSGTYSIKI